MQRSHQLPENSTTLHMSNTIREIVRPASRDLEDEHGYHHGEFGVDGYVKAFGHFDGFCVDGEIEMNTEDGYVLDSCELPFWCFKSDSGCVVMYASGAIEIGEVVDASALGGEIVCLLTNLYAVNC